MYKLITFIIALAAGLLCNSLTLQAQTPWSGSGTSSDPYQISSVDNLIYLSQQVSAEIPYGGVYFEQTADLDLGSIADWTPIGTSLTGTLSLEEEWPMLLDVSSSAFSGNYDGGGYTISNMTITTDATSQQYYLGLFAIVSGGTIQNLNLANVIITDANSQSIAGGFCGYGSGVTITNCSFQGTISGSASAGGICGWAASSSTISNCSSSGTVSESTYIGGICGNATLSTNISGCVNASTVTGAAGGKYSGGICGALQSAATTQCLNMGVISGGSDVGGISGYISSTSSGAANASYSVNVMPVSGNNDVGGICGSTSMTSQSLNISNCYNTGNVSEPVNSAGNYGGICGNNSGATFANCYYDKQMCVAGGINNTDVTGASGVLTSGMTGTLPFNDATNWSQATGLYPIPKNISASDLTTVAATPIFLSANETVNSVTSNFSVGILNGVSYIATNSIVSINPATGAASITNYGSGTLTISKNSASKPITLQTFASCTFNNTSGDGLWSTTANWTAYPTSSDGVLIASDAELTESATVAVLQIEANATLTIASAGSLTVSGAIINNGSLIIEQGGQLYQQNYNIPATLRYNIEAWTTNPVGGWYTISSPVEAQSISDMFGAQQTTYPATVDLYTYDEPTYSWLNYNAGAISETNLLVGKGYLTAFETQNTLNFSGSLNNGAIAPISLSYASSYPNLIGWNLVGNPYPCNIKIGTQALVTSGVSTGYYSVTNGSALIASIDDIAIPPCTGFFVQANETGQTVTFNNISAAKESETSRYLAIEVSDNDYFDRAYLWFEQGFGLKKLAHLSEEVPMLFFEQNDAEYAIATIPDEKSIDEMPLCFKAGINERYTIKVDAVNMKFDYLHLADRYTGEDIDLLIQDTYTFTANGQQDESRFTLLFKAGNSGYAIAENFAIVDNGSLIINNINGKAQLQLIDILGRIVINKSFTGNLSEDFNLDAGVYTIRLIEPECIRYQKIIVQ